MILLRLLRSARDYITLPSVAKREACKDFFYHAPWSDPGINACVEHAVKWLCRAQDNSRSNDGGEARDYSLISGWNCSYPETTGYIIPTLLHIARLKGDEILRQRARRMLDWLVSIQFPEGGFQGGLADSNPRVPVTFNTGQILLGLAAGTEELGDEYREPMCRAAQWLVDSQDTDGCWRKNPTPFAAPGEKAYETHVAWGLFEAERQEPNRGFAESAMLNIQWALTLQRANGWFEKCCLECPDKPLTHTIGYVLRGIIEAYRFNKENELLDRAVVTADGLLSTIHHKDGFIPGQLDSMWNPCVRWACLTGMVQIATCWMMLFEYTGEDKYLKAALSANKFVRSTMKIDGPEDMRGGVKGAYPIYGDYGKYQYLNWACKFAIDSFLLEKKILEKKENA